MACVRLQADSSCKPPDGDCLEFVVLITSDDEKDAHDEGCCGWLLPGSSSRRWCHCSLKDRLAKAAGDLHGKLHIALLGEAHCLRCATPFTLKVDIVKPHVLYAKLPKEKTYVQTWEHEYLVSQTQELGYIFGVLGARKVHIKIRESHLNTRKCSVGALLGACNLGYNGKKVARRVNDVDLSLVFPPMEHRVNNLSQLLKYPEIYYLDKNDKWKNFVKQRLELGTQTINFSCDHENLLSTSRGIVAKFEKLGVEVTDEHSVHASVKIEFSAEFPPLSEGEGWVGLMTMPMHNRTGLYLSAAQRSNQSMIEEIQSPPALRQQSIKQGRFKAPTKTIPAGVLDEMEMLELDMLAQDMGVAHLSAQTSTGAFQSAPVAATGTIPAGVLDEMEMLELDMLAQDMGVAHLSAQTSTGAFQSAPVAATGTIPAEVRDDIVLKAVFDGVNKCANKYGAHVYVRQMEPGTER